MLIWHFFVGDSTSQRLTLQRLGAGLASIVALLFFLLPLPTGLAAGQDGKLDLTFKSGAGPNSGVNSIAVQSDGKILIGGNFTTYNDIDHSGILRLNPDGRLDPTFNPGTGTTGAVLVVTFQSDGKILIGGTFTGYNGLAANRIARLNPDGSLDATFEIGSGFDGGVNRLTLQSDGKILIGGSFNTYKGQAANYIARLNPDGSLDTTFNSGSGTNNSVLSIALQNDGKILIGGGFTSYNDQAAIYVARLNPDGSLDTTFNSGGAGPNASVVAVACQSDGKILISGGFTSYNGTARNRVARLNSDGSLDTTFTVGNWLGGTPTAVYSLAIQNDGKVLVGGSFASTNQRTRKQLVRLNTNGSGDPNFSTSNAAFYSVLAIALQSDGKVLVGGTFPTYQNTTMNRIARLNSDGIPDTTFLMSSGTGANEEVKTVVMQADGKILIGGSFSTYNNTLRIGTARLNPDGSLDTTFSPAIEGITYELAIQTDGKVIMGGSFSSAADPSLEHLARLNPDGSLDTSFNPGATRVSSVDGIAIQDDGKILVAGNFLNSNNTLVNGIIRLNPDGSLDTSFNPGVGPKGYLQSLALQTDGKILIGGYFNGYNNLARNDIVRLNPDGTPDPIFNAGSGADEYGGVLSIASQLDGKVLIGGTFTSYNGKPTNRIARLNPDGSLDTTFNTGFGLNEILYSLAVQSDGKILIAGYFSNYNGVPINNVARLNPDGSLDTTFQASGAGTTVKTVVSQSDGKVIIAGDFVLVDGYNRNRIARLEGTLNPGTSLNLTSSSNSAVIGASVTFTATIQPSVASGVVSFKFNGLSTVTSPVVDGVATYITNTLPAGTYTVTAIYGGDNNYASSISPAYTQLIVAACNPQIVTSNVDDGQATTCGTLSYALATTSGGTISFALASGNTISFTGSLTPTLAAGVILDGGEANGIVLEGNGVAGAGLRLGGGNKLINLTVRHFSGRELVTASTVGTNPNQLYRVKIEG